MADRCTRVWDLRDAALCEDDTPGPGGCSERGVGTLEQRADRRTDQQIEDPQASDVWPRRCRLAPRSDDAVAGRQLAPTVNQTPSLIEPATLFSSMAAGSPCLSRGRLTALGSKPFASGIGTLGQRFERRQPRTLLTPSGARRPRRIEGAAWRILRGDRGAARDGPETYSLFAFSGGHGAARVLRRRFRPHEGGGSVRCDAHRHGGVGGAQPVWRGRRSRRAGEGISEEPNVLADLDVETYVAMGSRSTIGAGQRAVLCPYRQAHGAANDGDRYRLQAGALLGVSGHARRLSARPNWWCWASRRARESPRSSRSSALGLCWTSPP